MDLRETTIEDKIIDTFEIYFKKNILYSNEIIIVKNNKNYFSLKDEKLSEIKALNIINLEKLNYYYFNKDELFLLEKEFGSTHFFKNKVYKKTFLLKNKKENYIILYLENIRLTFSIAKEKEYESLREGIRNQETFDISFKSDMLNDSIEIINNFTSLNYETKNLIIQVIKEVSKNMNLIEYIRNIENSFVVNNLKEDIIDFKKEVKEKKKSFLLEDGFFISDEFNLNLKDISGLYFDKINNKISFYFKNYDRAFSDYCSLDDFKEISQYHRDILSEKIDKEIL